MPKMWFVSIEYNKYKYTFALKYFIYFLTNIINIDKFVARPFFLALRSLRGWERNGAEVVSVLPGSSRSSGRRRPGANKNHHHRKTYDVHQSRLRIIAVGNITYHGGPLPFFQYRGL